MTSEQAIKILSGEGWAYEDGCLAGDDIPTFPLSGVREVSITEVGFFGDVTFSLRMSVADVGIIYAFPRKNTLRAAKQLSAALHRLVTHPK